MRNLEARLARLEAAKERAENPNGGIFFVIMNDGESEDQALRRTMRKRGVGKRPPKRLVPIFMTARDAAL